MEQSATDPLLGPGCEQSDVFAGLLDDLQIPEESQTPVFVELCTGSAKLSDAVKQFGYNIVAVDYDKNRRTANWFNWICLTNMHGTCWTFYFNELW